MPFANAVYQILITNLCIIITQATQPAKSPFYLSPTTRAEATQPHRYPTLCKFIAHTYLNCKWQSVFCPQLFDFASSPSLSLPTRFVAPFELDKLKFNNSKRFRELISNVQTDELSNIQYGILLYCIIFCLVSRRGVFKWSEMGGRVTLNESPNRVTINEKG